MADDGERQPFDAPVGLDDRQRSTRDLIAERNALHRAVGDLQELMAFAMEPHNIAEGPSVAAVRELATDFLVELTRLHEIDDVLRARSTVVDTETLPRSRWDAYQIAFEASTRPVLRWVHTSDGWTQGQADPSTVERAYGVLESARRHLGAAERRLFRHVDALDALDVRRKSASTRAFINFARGVSDHRLVEVLDGLDQRLARRVMFESERAAVRSPLSTTDRLHPREWVALDRLYTDRELHDDHRIGQRALTRLLHPETVVRAMVAQRLGTRAWRREARVAIDDVDAARFDALRAERRWREHVSYFPPQPGASPNVAAQQVQAAKQALRNWWPPATTAATTTGAAPVAPPFVAEVIGTVPAPGATEAAMPVALRTDPESRSYAAAWRSLALARVAAPMGIDPDPSALGNQYFDDAVRAVHQHRTRFGGPVITDQIRAHNPVAATINDRGDLGLGLDSL